jgi:hypothetical protein
LKQDPNPARSSCQNLEHWEEIFDTEEEDEDERQPGTFQVCTVFSLSRLSNFGYKVRQPPGMQKK